MNDPIEVYLSNDGWAYPGVYQKLGNLPGLTYNEKSWTLLGALVIELLKSRHYNVTIYHDSRLVDEWSEDIEFMSVLAKTIAVRLKNDYSKRFLSFEIKRLDSRTISKEIERLKLT
jgi:hypothetical protein